MTRFALPCLLSLLALPLGAQAWDVRLEGMRSSGAALSQGQGLTLTGSHRIVRVNPVLKLEWCAEATDWRADGRPAPPQLDLRQRGIGLGLNAQFWVPFTGLAGETAVIQRLQELRGEGPAGSAKENHHRTWLRVGLRYRLPLPTPGIYVATSWQGSLGPETPGLANRAWSLGLGMAF